MEDLCRICRKNCHFNPIPLLSDHDGVPLKQMLTKTCPIDITFDDPVSQLLPQSICTDCLEVVTAAYNLQQVCIESDQYFRSMVASDQIVVKTENIEDELHIKVEAVEVQLEEVYEPSPKRRRKQTKSEFADPKKPSKCNRVEMLPSEKFRHPRTNKFRLRRVDGGNFHICYFCDYKKKMKLSVLKHMWVHCPGPFPFPCEYCTERFVNEDGLIQHGSRAHSETDIKSTLFCDLCGVSGNKKEGMKHHIQDDHLKIPKQYKTKKSNVSRCQHCFKYIEEKKMAQHVLLKHERKNKCDKCNEIFENKKEFNHHIVHCALYRQLEQHEIETCFKCCICEVNHETQDKLTRHLYTHEPELRASSQINCYLCARTSKNFQELVEHSKFHSEPKTHECLTCKKRYPFGKTLVAHVKRHGKEDERVIIKCDKCGKKCVSEKDLDIHDRVKHRKETLFICPICAKSFCSPHSLDFHIRFQHSAFETKNFECKICHMKFSLLKQLKLHEVVHSTERPHVCDICGNTFKLAKGLRKHKHMVHNPNLKKKFECSQCSFKFAEKNKLTQHMLTHTGLKPHECKFCDRAYASKGDLVKHMQKLHVGDEIYQCDKCPRGFRLMTELRVHQAEHAEKNS